MPEPRYFDSPEQAVSEIIRLLLEEDWITLSQYYYLDDSPVGHDELLSGDYFIEPWHGHPAFKAKYHYKHPFDPALCYDNSEEDETGRVTVTLSYRDSKGGKLRAVVIKQGADVPDQVGRFPDVQFHLIHSAAGFQVLPEDPEAVETTL